MTPVYELYYYGSIAVSSCKLGLFWVWNDWKLRNGRSLMTYLHLHTNFLKEFFHRFACVLIIIWPFMMEFLKMIHLLQNIKRLGFTFSCNN